MVDVTVDIVNVDDEAHRRDDGPMLVDQGAAPFRLALLELADVDSVIDDVLIDIVAAPVTVNHRASAPTEGVTQFSFADLVNELVLYEHDGNETATDSFDFSVVDPSGNTLTDLTFNIQILPLNDANNDFAATDEDTPIEIDVLQNDFDDGNGISLTNLNTDETRGVALISGAMVSYDPSGQFDELAPGETAVDRFSYSTLDSDGNEGTATVEVTILGINDAAVAVDDTVTTLEEVAVSINVLQNDIDPDGEVSAFSGIAETPITTTNVFFDDFEGSSGASLQWSDAGVESLAGFSRTIPFNGRTKR